MNGNMIKLNEVKAYVNSNVMLQCAQLAAPRLAIQGAPGCGKSDIMRQICEENGWLLSVKYLSNMSLEQITGIPCKVENGSTAVWSKPELFNFDNPEYAPEKYEQDKDGTVKVLLIDDFHLADKIMQKYLFQLLTYKSLNGYKLPPNTAIILAGNRIVDKAGANVIPAPVCNRMMFVEVRCDTEDWLNNFAFKNGVREDITSYLYSHTENLAGDPIETAAWASPRSWTYLSYQMDAYEKAFGKMSVNDLKIMASGLIGAEYTGKFIEYRELFSKWNFDKLFKMNFERVAAELNKAIEDNPTNVYAIVSAGMSWLFGFYKNKNYNSDDTEVKDAVTFIYDCLTSILSNKKTYRNSRPMVAAGCKYLHDYEKAIIKSNKKAGSILHLIFTQMKQQRDIDWIFYELIANINDYDLDDEDKEAIAKAKENLKF